MISLVGLALAAAAGLLAGPTLARAVVPVSDVAGLTSAIQNAAAGDEIVLAPGRGGTDLILADGFD